MDTLEEAIAWLYGSQRHGIKFGLENTKRLLGELKLLDAPQRFIHVAGTNGKGSTCAFLESLLRRNGIRTGLFTSPHLIRFNERIRVDFKETSDGEVLTGIQRLRQHVADNHWEHDPTFFELTLSLALGHFRDQEVDVVVLETGLGGRLDATNAAPDPLVSVITPIGLDHQSMLGDTLSEIAAEKAGIIKAGVPVVSSPQQPEAEDVLRRKASLQGSEITFLEDEEELPLGASTGVAGPHQRSNASLASLAFEKAGFSLNPSDRNKALEDTRWRGRFETVKRGDQSFVIDGAHNPAAAKALRIAWQEAFGDKRACIVFGGVRGKDLRGVIEELRPIAEKWILVEVPSPRAQSLEALRSELHPLLPADTQGFPDAEQGVLAGLESGGPVLVAGSLFLVGHILAWTEGNEEFFQRSRQ